VGNHAGAGPLEASPSRPTALLAHGASPPGAADNATSVAPRAVKEIAMTPTMLVGLIFSLVCILIAVVLFAVG
jgi:hypothetical protein